MTTWGVIDAKLEAFQWGASSFVFHNSPLVSEADVEAIRRDTTNLIVCYVNQFRTSYIPRTTLLPVLPLSDGPDQGQAERFKSDPVYRSQILRERAESESNERNNALSLRLETVFSKLEGKQAEPVFNYFLYAYSLPPTADAELAWLLDFLKYRPAAREKLLTQIEQRKAYLRDEAEKRSKREAKKTAPAK